MSQSLHSRGPGLIVVGTGIQSAGHTTPIARKAIEQADKVLFAVGDPWTVRWLRELNPSAESLPYPLDGTLRTATYCRMTELILDAVRQGQRVCAVFYGHPCVLAAAGRAAVEQATREGYPARMLPGISALDCLFSDLGFDPILQGCLMAEANDFLEKRRGFEAQTPLILLQIAAIGNHSFYDPTQNEQIRRGLERLTQRLLGVFPAQHRGVLYEAAVMPTDMFRREEIELCCLPAASVTDLTTLFVPAVGTAERHPGIGKGWREADNTTTGVSEEVRV